MILSNQARCRLCGSEPFSQHRHDFVYCGCSNVFVDGGMDYLRHGFPNLEDYENISIVLDDLPCEVAMSAIEWGLDNKRNSLGILCAIARGLRDCGYEIREINDES